MVTRTRVPSHPERSTSPGVAVNDLGTLSRTDFKWMQASVLRQWTKPTKWYRDAAAIVGGQQAFNYFAIISPRPSRNPTCRR